MLLPTKSFNVDSLCPSKLLHPRSFTSDVASTAKSFKSWDTCMDNKTCKIVAIVGIVLAVIVAIWIVGGLARCLCYGVTGIAELFCCCCKCCGSNGQRRGGYQREMSDIPKQTVYDNPHMYPSRPAPVYDNSAWNQGSYIPVHQQPQQQFNYGPGVISDEDKYDYHNNNVNNHGYRTNGNYR